MTGFGGGARNGPIVRINGAGDLFLVSLPNYQLTVDKFDGTSWQQFGGALVQTGEAEDYDMTVDLDGLPIVADLEGSGGGSQE